MHTLLMMKLWWMLSKAMVRFHSSTRHEKEKTMESNRNEEEQGADGRTVLMHIISQLRPGADLSRVTLPTFILEPRSMLERITK